MEGLNGLIWIPIAFVFLGSAAYMWSAWTTAKDPQRRPGHRWVIRGQLLAGFGMLLQVVGWTVGRYQFPLGLVLLFASVGVMFTAAWNLWKGTKLNSVDGSYREELRKVRRVRVAMALFIVIVTPPAMIYWLR